MPYSYEISLSQRLIRVTYAGHVTTKDILELLDAVERDPAYVPGMAELGDLSRVEALDFGARDLPRLAQLVAGLYLRHRPAARSAFWAPSDRTYFTTSRYCALLRALRRVEAGAFREEAEALAFAVPAAGSTRQPGP